jgi:hypothetical protein
MHYHTQGREVALTKLVEYAHPAAELRNDPTAIEFGLDHVFIFRLTAPALLRQEGSV